MATRLIRGPRLKALRRSAGLTGAAVVRLPLFMLLATVACGQTSAHLPAYSYKGYPRATQPPAAPAAPQPPALVAKTSSSATTTATTTTSGTKTATKTAPTTGATAQTPADTAKAQSPFLPPQSPPPPSAAQLPYEPPLPLTSADPSSAPRGPRFAVRGVDREDVLNVRAQPGPQSAVVGELPPGTTGIATTGARRRVGPGTWREVRYGNVRGWVNERFLVEERDGDSVPRLDASSGSPRR